MDAILDKMPLDVRVVKPEKIVTLLKPGELGAMLDWKVFDPKTGIVTSEGTKKSESFLKAFLQLLFVNMIFNPSNAPISITDITPAARNIYQWLSNAAKGTFNMEAAAALVTNGIIIGTGITAPTISDSKIETIIPHATMNYSAQSFAAPAADATTSQVTLTRNFSNVSGGNVTVNEIALYCQARDTAGTARSLCIIRDKITGGILVPNGQTLTINYRPQAVA